MTKNNTIVAQGGIVTLDIYLYEYQGGGLIAPDSLPTFSIFDPSDNEVLADTNSTLIDVGHYTASYTLPSNAEISSGWYITWNASVNGNPVLNTKETFSVIASGEAGFDVVDTKIIISDEWLNKIKTVIAYPLTDNLILDDSQIKELCVSNALIQYFSRFPLKDFTKVTISNSASIDFPDELTYGVLDVRVTQRDQGSSGFWDTYRYNQLGGTTSGSRSYGIKGYNPNGLRQVAMDERMLANTLQTTYSDTRYEIHNRKVNVNTTTNGDLSITWAKSSYNFEDVDFNKKLDVIALCQSYLLSHLADSTSIISDGNLSLSINSSDLKSRADESY